ncbi:hypothetical protein BVG19_g5789 [[Candida] boidinii]|nr:hypothetical protein BVG19_g5789 [[Candida] boidinii]
MNINKSTIHDSPARRTRSQTAALSSTESPPETSNKSQYQQILTNDNSNKNKITGSDSIPLDATDEFVSNETHPVAIPTTSTSIVNDDFEFDSQESLPGDVSSSTEKNNKNTKKNTTLSTISESEDSNSQLDSNEFYSLPNQQGFNNSNNSNVINTHQSEQLVHTILHNAGLTTSTRTQPPTVHQLNSPINTTAPVQQNRNLDLPPNSNEWAQNRATTANSPNWANTSNFSQNSNSVTSPHNATGAPVHHTRRDDSASIRGADRSPVLTNAQLQDAQRLNTPTSQSHPARPMSYAETAATAIHNTRMTTTNVISGGKSNSRRQFIAPQYFLDYINNSTISMLNADQVSG